MITPNIAIAPEQLAPAVGVKSPLIGVELFCGAGGLSCGAEQAGVTVSTAIDVAQPATRTFQTNHPHSRVICDDIRMLQADAFSDGSAPTIVFGGPPCQGFSTSNQKTRSLNNEGNWLFKEFLRFVQTIDPIAVVFENVSGITHTAKGFFEAELKRSLVDLGYEVTSFLLDASQVGVPQKRTRYFCVAAKGKKIVIPTSNGSGGVTVEDAIGDLPSLKVGDSFNELPYATLPRSEYAAALRGNAAECGGHLVTRNAEHIVERYKFVPQGGNWADIPKHMMSTYRDVKRCHTGIYRRLRNDEPSIVLGNFRKNMLIHPTQDRGLSVREAARIQSFPDNYRFSGSIGQQQQQVGNAVPPLLARHVFTHLLQQLGI